MAWQQEIKLTHYLGIERLDQQHADLIGLINHLMEAVLQKAPNHVLAEKINVIYQASAEHFAEEEQYFHCLQPSDRKLHTLQHKHILEELLLLIQQLQNSEFKLREDISGSLIDWFAIHIECEDMKLAQCQQKHRCSQKVALTAVK